MCQESDEAGLESVGEQGTSGREGQAILFHLFVDGFELRIELVHLLLNRVAHTLSAGDGIGKGGRRRLFLGLAKHSANKTGHHIA